MIPYHPTTRKTKDVGALLAAPRKDHSHYAETRDGVTTPLKCSLELTRIIVVLTGLR
jgi:hypothetical protein